MSCLCRENVERVECIEETGALIGQNRREKKLGYDTTDDVANDASGEFRGQELVGVPAGWLREDGV